MLVFLRMFAIACFGVPRTLLSMLLCTSVVRVFFGSGPLPWDAVFAFWQTIDTFRDSAAWLRRGVDPRILPMQASLWGQVVSVPHLQQRYACRYSGCSLIFCQILQYYLSDFHIRFRHSFNEIGWVEGLDLSIFNAVRPHTGDGFLCRCEHQFICENMCPPYLMRLHAAMR
jgi:hypothetical protein